MKKIIVVDDDSMYLKSANKILSENGFDVECLNSGQELLEIPRSESPALILLDVHMTEMDGFETLKKLKQLDWSKNAPVVFLTADDDAETETRGLSAGAIDFIKKPFVAEILLLRVRNTIELLRLQTDLKAEVERKNYEIIREHQRNERLSMQVVETLAGAIDAKDAYTNGHSVRVAEYARRIAKRAGYSLKMQNEIYMIGLLHDVGKIGVPDEVINKPFRLTEEEYALIKTHPIIGHSILKNITELPQLAVGARWHHERYDGKGYPDGLSGTDIPEAARIIAVADAYDAMSSRRSYHDVFSQEYIKNELQNGKGTQFDPVFAEYMCEMIDEDTDYTMRVHSFESLLKDEDAPDKKADPEEVLRDGGIDVNSGLMYCMNDKGFYFDMLRDFAAAAPDKETGLHVSVTVKDWGAYRIAVHSLKSTAKTIGANEFSTFAKKLEDAAKASDGSYILSHHSEFIECYHKTVRLIHRALFYAD